MPLHSPGRPVIAVLSTSFSGSHYFAKLLAGVAAETAAAGGRLLAVQTCPAGAPVLDLARPPDFRLPIARDRLSGVIVILNAVGGEYLASLQEAGIPVAVIGTELAGVSCPVALSDNRSGVTAAVEHLIGHGHRAIAFAGYPVSRDLAERYEAYRDCLLAHGITPDPALYYNTGNNQDTGGEQAARAMIAAGLPSTAVVAGNDFNALGIIETLTRAGYTLPTEQAVVGFDDMDPAIYCSPSLSTVRQDFVQVGATAARTVLEASRGVADPATARYVPGEFVARESCGCGSTLTLHPQRPVRPAADIVVDAVREVLRKTADDGELPVAQQLLARLEMLHAEQSEPERFVELMRAARDFGRSLVPESGPGVKAARRRMEDAIQEVQLALSLAVIRAGRSDLHGSETTFAVQHAVSTDLLRAGQDEDPRQLGWLTGTSARAAVLASWAADPGDLSGRGRTVLGIEGTFHATDPEWHPDAGPMPVESFPPAELLELGDPALHELVFVVPLEAGVSGPGLLALAGPIEARMFYGREIMNQWAALLGTALDHRAVLESLRAQEELLRHAALYDELTGLPNRTLLLDRVRTALEQFRRHPNRRFGVCLLDLDGFKLVNDSLGHLAGDQLLVEVADRIRSCVRGADSAARLGGDEFALLLDGLADADDAAGVAARLRDAFTEPCTVAGQDIVVTASVGIALSGRRYEQPEELIRDADMAMYSAKAREKGSHAVFDVGMHTRAVGRLRMERELRHALDQGELELHYQPIVNLLSGRTVAFEGLIRWRHPENGMLSPAEFLPVAEDCGLMLPIGRWVLAEGCRQLGEWQQEFGPGIDVCIDLNVDNRLFWQGHLVEEIDSALSAAGLAPHRLKIEITEGVVMHDVPQARLILDGLHELGVDVHIDDFGTGYSSLEALNHLRIDALKIDRSFVMPLPGDRRSEELVRAIIAMGRNLGLNLIAEGIETPAQRDLLRDLGCTLGQGYWFCRPLAAAAARDRVATEFRSLRR